MKSQFLVIRFTFHRCMHRKLHRLNRRLVINRRRQSKRLRLLSRHPFMIPVAVFVLLATITGGGLWLLLSRGASLTPALTDLVIVSYDHHTETIPSREPTVGTLLAKLHIAINPGDVVEPDVTTPIHQDEFRINVYRALPVKIVDGSSVITSHSAATTPRSMAQQAGVTLYPEDALSSEPATNFLAEQAVGNVVVIDRSVPIQLNLNGLVSSTRTRAKTVRAFLAEQHLTLGKGDSVQPDASQPIVPNETIAMLRNGAGIQSITQAIPMPIQYINDNSLAYGTFAVRQVGGPGTEILTYRTLVQNGQIVSRTLLQTVVTVQAITQIEARGTNLGGIKGDMALAGISPDDYYDADYIISHESGWCPTKIQGQYGGCAAYAGYVPAYGGYGLCQATPGGKMASAGADWATNPITQLIWCNSYAISHYGSWTAAYDHWVTYTWW